jgi:hypothetical protein
MDYVEKKKLSHELAKTLIQDQSVKPVSDNGNLKFEIDGDFFTYQELCHYFFIEIDNFETY